VELNLRGFDRPDVKIIDFSLLVMKHYDLGFDQSSIDHRFENVAAARAVSTLFRIAQLRLIQPRYDNIPVPVTAMAVRSSPLRCASDVRPPRPKGLNGIGSGWGLFLTPQSATPGQKRLSLSDLKRAAAARKAI
jgi:hypothetical protein